MALGLGLGLQNENKVSEAGFSLTDIAGLQLWLKNDSGILEANGAISVWKDKSPYRNDALQTVESRKPRLAGRNILFDGIDDRFDLKNEFSVNEFTIAVIINPLQSAPDTESILGRDTANFLRVHQGGQLDRVYMQASGTSMDQAKLQSDLPTETFLLVVTRATGVIDNCKVRVDGVDISEAARDNFDSTRTLYIDTIATSGGGLNPFDGYINEVAIYNSALTGDDLSNVESDIMSRNGL